MKSEFPAWVNLHIYTLCPTCLQCFKKFCGIVKGGLWPQTVYYCIQYIGPKVQKGLNFKKISLESEYPRNMHIYALCLEYLQSLTIFCAGNVLSKRGLMDWLIDSKIIPNQLQFIGYNNTQTSIHFLVEFSCVNF